MNTYKIIFTRENGTQGTDHFTAINERQARKDFGECYRHGTATIISIELASTNTPATKQQERDTLEKIRKMVEQLGPDSYLATAFEGCFDLAAENIDNDWACSMADRARCHQRKGGHTTMTRFKYYSNYLACLLGTLIAFELCWIGAKYVIEGEVVHTCLDHFIAVCGSFYITRDTMKIWLKLQKKVQK